MCQSFYVELKFMCIDIFMSNLCTSIFLQSTKNVEIESMCSECVHQIYIWFYVWPFKTFRLQNDHGQNCVYA